MRSKWRSISLPISRRIARETRQDTTCFFLLMSCDLSRPSLVSLRREAPSPALLVMPGNNSLLKRSSSTSARLTSTMECTLWWRTKRKTKKMKPSALLVTMLPSMLTPQTCHMLPCLLLHMGRPCISHRQIRDIIILMATGAKLLHMGTMSIMLRHLLMGLRLHGVLMSSRLRGDTSTTSILLNHITSSLREEANTEEVQRCKRLGLQEIVLDELAFRGNYLL